MEINMKKILSGILTFMMLFGIMNTAIAAEMNFVDVQPDAWYYEEVKYV